MRMAARLQFVIALIFAGLFYPAIGHAFPLSTQDITNADVAGAEVTSGHQDDTYSPADSDSTAQLSFVDTDENDSLGIRPVPTSAPVPEPATLLLVGSGLVAVTLYGRKRLGLRRTKR